MNKWEKMLIFLTTTFLLLFVGSSCIQDLLIPAYVNEEAAAWAGVPTKMINPLYTTLWDAKRVALWIAFKKQQYMIEWKKRNPEYVKVYYVKNKAHWGEITKARERKAKNWGGIRQENEDIKRPDNLSNR